MTEELSYQQVLDLLPAYILGALEPDEMLAVGEYIDRQRSLLERLDSVEVAVSQLALAAPDQLPAPSSAKNALMARVRAELGDPGKTEAAQESQTRASEPPAALPSESKPQPSKPVKWGLASGSVRSVRSERPTQPPRRILPRSPLVAGAAVARSSSTAVPPRRAANALRPRKGPPAQTTPRGGPPPRSGRSYAFPLWPWIASASVAAIAMVIAAVAAGSFYGQMQDLTTQLHTLRQEIAGYVTQIDRLNGQVEELQQQVSDEQQQVALFTEADRVIPVSGTEGGAGIQGAFYQRGSQGVLTLHGLVPLPSEQVYQLWLIPSDGAPAPAGLLTSADAALNFELEIPDAIRDFVTVGVSIEPAGGSSGPTGPIVALGQT